MISFARLLQGKSVYLNSHMIFRISYGHLVARFVFMFFYEECTEVKSGGRGGPYREG